MKTVCVIPAFNEEKNIAAVISKVKPFVDEIVVIDDCSHDNTFAIAKTAGAHARRHPLNCGQGAALQTGTDLALRLGADIIVHFDADDQFAAAEIPDILAPIKNGQADVVFGSRFLEKKSDLPWKKKYIIWPLGRFINRLCGVKTSDPQSGFRAYTRAVAESFRIDNSRMAHCTEILIKLTRGQWRVAEVPITVTYHEYGQKFSGGIRILKDLFIQKINK